MRNDLEYMEQVKSNEFDMKSDGAEESSDKFDSEISDDFKMTSNETIRNQTITNENEGEIVTLLKGQIEGLENDKHYLKDQLKEKAGEAENLNKELQEVLNTNSTETVRGGRNFRVGDKVMQIRNNYDYEVFNGDIGRITGVDHIEKQVSITFPDKTVAYDMADLNELVLAYATTVHKAQGSEYPAVVLYGGQNRTTPQLVHQICHEQEKRIRGDSDGSSGDYVRPASRRLTDANYVSPVFVVISTQRGDVY